MAGGSLSDKDIEKIIKEDNDSRHLPVSKPEPHERGK